MEYLSNFFSNPWIIGVNGIVITGLVVYYVFVAGKGMKKYIIPKLVILILLFIGTITENFQFRLTFLITAGILSGIYNGYYNDIQWRAQGKDDNKNKEKPEDCLHRKTIDAPYRIHQMFNHIICGLIAAICFYLLLSKINPYEPLKTIEHFSWGDLVLFVIALTGFVGILPRAIWYWSYSGKLND